MLQKKIVLILTLISHFNVMKPLLNNHLPGFLCTIEGIDGSGKSTLLKNLKSFFDKDEYNVFFTKEPGATNIGKQLRSIILNQENPTCAFSEFLLFAADRAQHFQEFIIPKLTDGNLIISDRMADSSIVYQGYLKGIDLHKIDTINNWCMQGIQPDITFYLRINSKDAQNRIQKIRGLNDKFEKELISHLDTLVTAFDTIFNNRNNVIIIDASQDQEAIAIFVYKKIIELYLKKQKSYG